MGVDKDMKPLTNLTAKRLREVLNYNSETGVFTAKIHAARRRRGEIAGCRKRPSWWISVDGTRYQAHRLAWLYVYGKWPLNEIDHINGNKVDNRINNLRDVTKSINLHNKKAANSQNKLGLRGVSPYEKNYLATVNVNNKRIYSKSFKTPEEAHAAYLKIKQENGLLP